MSTPTEQTGPAPTCNTSDMVLIHKVFRQGFRDAPGLVRGVADGDRKRVEIVAPHVLKLAASLHSHHHGEDLLLWDTLEQRAPACALHVGQMRAQHAAVGALLDQVEAAIPVWVATAGADDRDKVATLMDQILATLEEHLGNEERLILPVAATSFTQAEWDKLGEHGRASIPKNEQFIQLGFIVDVLGPEEGQRFIREFLPGPLRLLWATIGKRQFANYKRRVYAE
jgi:hypothetical protein